MYFRKIRKVAFVTLSLALMVSCSAQKETKNVPTQKQLVQFKDRPIYLYKVLSLEDFAQSCKTIHLSKMDSDFIHFSTELQLDKIIEKYFAKVSTYMVLKLETAKLPGNLVLEANPGGTTKYYHLYNGSIPLSAILEAKVHKK